MRILILFLFLLGAVGLGVQLNQDPGYVLVSINHWSLETTAWIAGAAIIICFFMFHACIILCQSLINAPKKIHHLWLKRRCTNAQKKTKQGLIEFSEGYWQQAKNHLISALPGCDTPLLNYLTAARAAQELGDSTLRDHYLRDALKAMPDAKIAVELTQAQLQLANQQWEQALATLRHLHDLAPKHPYVLKLLAQLYEEVKDWSALITLLPALKKNQVIKKQNYLALEKHIYLETFIQMAAQNQNQALLERYTTLPKTLNLDPDILLIYCQTLLKEQQKSNAEQLLRQVLQKNYNDKLINLYGQIHLNDKQLHFAESLLKNNQHSAALHLCLARLCRQQQLWGKAKHYFEQSLSLRANAQTYAEYAELLEQELGDKTAAFNAYRQGLQASIQNALSCST